MPDQPSLRASDADRDRAAATLREAYAEGRLTSEEFQDRTGRALAAKTVGDLTVLTADLPAPPTPVVPSSAEIARRRDVRRIWTAWISMAVLLNAVWLLTVFTSSSFPGYWPVWPLGITGALAVVRTINLRMTDGDPRPPTRPK
jgi:hypothetical protein